MLNIAISYNDNNKIKILNEFLNVFFKSLNIKYKVFNFYSLDYLISAPPKSIDILLINVKLNNRNSVLDINNKINFLYTSSQLIFIPEIVDFMINGFYMKDFNYILPPLKYDCFKTELNLCLKNIDYNKNQQQKITGLYPHINIPSEVKTRSIIYIYSNKNTSLAYTDTNVIHIPHNLSFLEKNLDCNIFFRCHDNYIINLYKLKKINKDNVLTNLSIIPISKHKFPSLKNKLIEILKLN